MSKDRSTLSDEDFLARLGHLSDEAPVTEAEAGVLLEEAGIDAQGSLQRLLAKIEDFDTQSKRNRFARVDADRKAALAQLSSSTHQRPRAELLTRLSQLRASSSEQPQAYFRSLESLPDGDLESLVSQLEEMVGREKEK